jgi:5-methyltetrahydrofolate--homocysteine methyltransferase
MRREAFAAMLADGFVLLDGGMGSMLIAAGLPPGEPPERWNLDHPGRVEAVQRAYIAAGSRIVHTNTFGATRAKLGTAGLAARCEEINAAGVVIARRAAGSDALVAGDVGPTGLLLPPLGEATESLLREAFAVQVAALAGAGADLLSIETMYDLREALAAVAAGRETGLPVVASMTFERRRRGIFTVMGDPLVGALARLAEAGADAVGCNCSVGPEAMVAMIREAHAAVPAPLAAQPNAGTPRATPGGPAYDVGPADFGAFALAVTEAGARLVGGCCGTTPAHIGAAREALR